MRHYKGSERKMTEWANERERERDSMWYHDSDKCWHSFFVKDQLPKKEYTHTQTMCTETRNKTKFSHTQLN